MKDQEFTESYQEYYHIVYSSMASKLENKMDAEDITQEIFLLLYDKFEEVENIRKWLYGTMRNKVYEFLRSKYHKEKDDIALIMNDVQFTYANGFKETRIMIMSTLDRVGIFKDTVNEVIFNLIIIHNATFVETAESTGLSKSTVRRKYYKMIEKVTEELQKQGIKKLEDLL